MLSSLVANSVLYLNNLGKVKKGYFYNKIDYSDKLIRIIRVKGVGKTTYLLNYLKNLKLSFAKKLYFSANKFF